jgi:hypothetical protein
VGSVYLPAFSLGHGRVTCPGLFSLIAKSRGLGIACPFVGGGGKRPALPQNEVSDGILRISCIPRLSTLILWPARRSMVSMYSFRPDGIVLEQAPHFAPQHSLPSRSPTAGNYHHQTRGGVSMSPPGSLLPEARATARRGWEKTLRRRLVTSKTSQCRGWIPGEHLLELKSVRLHAHGAIPIKVLLLPAA